MTITTKIDDTAAHAALATGSNAPAQHVSTAPLSLREGERAALRPAVALVDGALTRLEGQQDLEGYARAAEQLAASWKALVGLMALGTAPELRSCPHCGYRIFAKATRCIQCWRSSAAA